jgi:beta-1,4-galactosyltransferase 1
LYAFVNPVGFVDVTSDLDVNSTDDSNYTLRMVLQPLEGISLFGGRWLPDWCVARQRIAVIVPFKDREHHLDLFLRQVRPLLERQLLDYTIFVVEQVDSINSTFDI